MANSSAKKLHKANTNRLYYLRIAIFLVNLCYAIHFFFRRTRFDNFLWPILLAIYALPYYFLHVAARPTYSDSGDLIDGGEDISRSGLLEYVHDLIYLTAIVQIALIFTRWALLLFLAIPIFAVYMACAGSSFLSSAQQEEEQDHAPVQDMMNMSRKDRRKADRMARKQR